MSPEAHFSHLDFPDHTPTHQGHTPVIEGHTPTSQDHTLNFATSQNEGDPHILNDHLISSDSGDPILPLVTISSDSVTISSDSSDPIPPLMTISSDSGDPILPLVTISSDSGDPILPLVTISSDSGDLILPLVTISSDSSDPILSLMTTSSHPGGVSSLMTTSSEHLMTMSHEYLLDGGHNYEKGGVVFQTAPTGHGHCLVPIFTGPDEWAETTPPLSLLKPTPTPLFHAAQFLSRSFEPGDFPAASEPGDFPAASEMSTYSHNTCETDPPKVTLLDPVEEGMTASHPVGGRMNQCDPPSEGLDQYDLFDEELDPLEEGLDPLDEGLNPLGEGLDPLGEGVCQRDHSGRGMEGPVDPPSEGHDKGTTDSVPLVRSSYPPHVAGKERTCAPVLLPGLGEAGDQAEGAPPIRYTVVPPSCGKPRCASRLLKKSKKVFNSPYLLPNKQPVAGLQKSRVSKSDLCEAPGTMQLNLGGKLHFPCKEQCLQGEVPTRNTVIPHSFQDVFHYKSVLSCAVREHLNIILFTHSRRYHQAMVRVDMSAIDSPHLHTGTSPPPHPSPATPHCSHGPALLRVVKKAGPNQGRMFYTCSAGGQEHCKFFKWLDKTQGDQGNRGDKSTPLMKPSSGHELDTFLKANGVSFYSSCQLVVRSSSDGPIPGRVRYCDHIHYCLIGCFGHRGSGHRFNPQGLQPRPQLYVSLSRRGPSSEYSKGHVCCIHIGNASSELTCLANTEENLCILSAMVLHGENHGGRSGEEGIDCTIVEGVAVGGATSALNLSQEVAGQYGLNRDQTTALGKCAEMFSSSHEGPPLLLIHGVFGSGKTHLLSVMVLFLLKLFGESGVREGDTSAKILITSTTNVAVDRILTGFEGFVRVGSVKKIAKRILPLSYVRKSIEQHKRGVNRKGQWPSLQPQGLQPRPQLYVSLSRRGPSSEYSKGHVCCIHIGNASSELTCLANTEENLCILSAMVLHGENHGGRSGEEGIDCTIVEGVAVGGATSALNLSQEVAGQYGLNRDQTTALGKCAEMFSSSHEGPPLLLIHGVFGSGKTHLLSVMVLFLLKLFGESGVREGDTSAKILITSTTNVAVDRILTGLLDQGFEGFVRVGSVKKIAKRILPLSYVRKSIEQHKRGVNRKRLSSVMVVGVTTAACSFSLLEGMRFPVLLLDECSQMTEVASLIPMARFRCQKAVLVGDPKQLAPTIQGSEASHQQGLEQTLFERLVLMVDEMADRQLPLSPFQGHSPVLLRTQYRCHPRLSAIPNRWVEPVGVACGGPHVRSIHMLVCSLFYEGQLEDGVSHQDRLPLLPSLPTLCFLASNGREACAQDGSYYNSQEAQDVVSVISGLLEAGITSSNIGVITLYRAQVSHIRSVASSSDEGAG
eukprot:Em0002g1861a